MKYYYLKSTPFTPTKTTFTRIDREFAAFLIGERKAQGVEALIGDSADSIEITTGTECVIFAHDDYAGYMRTGDTAWTRDTCEGCGGDTKDGHCDGGCGGVARTLSNAGELISV